MSERTALSRSDSLEAAARSALAKHVRIYDEEDQVLVSGEPDELRLAYISVQSSQQPQGATFAHFRIEYECGQIWIDSLGVSDSRQRQGIGREIVQAIEATAREIGVHSIKVYPLAKVVGFWNALGYKPDARIARVLHKEVA